MMNSENWNIMNYPKTYKTNIDCKKSEPYSYCDRCTWNGFSKEVIYFKVEGTKSDDNIIDGTLFDDPELTQKHIHKVRGQSLIAAIDVTPPSGDDDASRQ